MKEEKFVKEKIVKRHKSLLKRVKEALKYEEEGLEIEIKSVLDLQNHKKNAGED